MNRRRFFATLGALAGGAVASRLPIPAHASDGTTLLRDGDIVQLVDVAMDIDPRMRLASGSERGVIRVDVNPAWRVAITHADGTVHRLLNPSRAQMTNALAGCRVRSWNVRVGL